jgi:hypothetical protein
VLPHYTTGFKTGFFVPHLPCAAFYFPEQPPGRTMTAQSSPKAAIAVLGADTKQGQSGTDFSRFDPKPCQEPFYNDCKKIG